MIRAHIESASVKLNNVDVKATAFALSGNGAASFHQYRSQKL